MPWGAGRLRSGQTSARKWRGGWGERCAGGRARIGCRFVGGEHCPRYGARVGFARHGVSRFARFRFEGEGVFGRFALGVPLGARKESPARFCAGEWREE